VGLFRAGIVVFAAVLGVIACATVASESDRTPASAILSRPPATAETTLPPGKKPQVVADAPKPVLSRQEVAAASPPAKPPPPDPRLLARAQELVATASKAYHAGAYDIAEAALKEAITFYPFIAEANLLLGKIFLLRGSAARDVSLVAGARLMFEMAHTIDPTLREADLLLELFNHEPSE
jgi:hypothetical protein